MKDRIFTTSIIYSYGKAPSVDPVARIVQKVSKLTLLTQFRVKIDTFDTENVESIEPENVKNVNFDTKLC